MTGEQSDPAGRSLVKKPRKEGLNGGGPHDGFDGRRLNFRSFDG